MLIVSALRLRETLTAIKANSCGCSQPSAPVPRAALAYLLKRWP